MSSSRDLLSQPGSAFALFCLPAIAIFITANSRFTPGLRTIVWTVSLIVLGAACIANAARCHRTHCYVTGPFFLVMAIVVAAYGGGVLPLWHHGWSFLSLTLVIGTIVLCCLPEWFFGRYRGPLRPS
ncbi:MAG: hypothetical protein WBG02_02440 [Candidatus Acidiferrum sp.]